MQKKDSEWVKTAQAMASAQWRADLSALTRERQESIMQLLEKMPGGKVRSKD